VSRKAADYVVRFGVALKLILEVAFSSAIEATLGLEKLQPT
jgi:hypothetical protein